MDKIQFSKIIRKITRDYINIRGRGFIKGFTANLTPEKIFLEQLNLKGLIVYDIGSSSGTFTVFFSRNVGRQGRVIAFEPLEENCRALEDRAKRCRLTNIEIINLGIGNEHGYRNIAVRAGESATASMQEEIFSSIKSEIGSTVRSIKIDTIDNLVLSRRILSPDFVKIDVEGMEIEVLYGMEQVIMAKKPILFCEIHGIDLNNKRKNMSEISKFLLAHQYSLHHVESNLSEKDVDWEFISEGHIYCR